MPSLAAVVLAAAVSAARAQQPLDTAYTAGIRALTSEPQFNTDLTNNMAVGSPPPVA